MKSIRENQVVANRLRCPQLSARTLCILITLVVLLAAPVSADIITVHTLNPGDSIQQNITDGHSGDTIILNPGTYSQYGITVSKNLTIMANTSYGGTAENTVIDAADAGRIFAVSSGVSFAIDNLTLKRGTSVKGGAIYVDSDSATTLNITSSIFDDCSATGSGTYEGNGGAIFVRGAFRITSITSSNFTGCSGRPDGGNGGGAIYSEMGTLSITSTTFSGCSAYLGGAISTASNPTTISSSTFTGNSGSWGGAIYAQDNANTIRFTRFTGNTAGQGPAIYYWYNSAGGVDATNNWWGSNSNPSGNVAAHSSTIVTDPWLVMNLTATPSSIPTAATSSIRVNLTRLSNGTDTAGSGVFVPDGIPVIFARTSGTGSIAPQAGNLTSGANTTTFTPSGTGTSTISATVDGQTVSTDITVLPPPVSRIGMYQDGLFALDNDSSFSWNTGDLAYTFGSAGDDPVVGDWDNDGLTEIGVFNSGAWYLDYNGNGVYDGPATDRAYSFGSPGYKPVIGDWNGDGADEIGVQLDGIWAIDYNGNGAWDGDGTDRFAAFGQAGDIPVVGDWNGDNRIEIGSHLDGFWAIDYNGDYAWSGTTDDRFAGLGQASDKPVIGDFNGDGRDEIGMETDGFWAVDYNGNYVWDGIGDDRFAGLGQSGDTPVVGDWDGNGKTEICSFVSGFWAIDYNGNYAWDGVSDDRFAGFGSGTAVPVVGAWS